MFIKPTGLAGNVALPAVAVAAEAEINVEGLRRSYVDGSRGVSERVNKEAILGSQS
jgi:hypothetical protein